MRKFIAIVIFLPLTAFAYPDLSNPKLKSVIERHKQDSILAKSPHFFDDVNALSIWTCPVSETELYTLAGLQGAHPQLKIEYDKMLRKTNRKTGGSNQELPNEKFSNIKFIPIKVECVKGKPDGEVQFLAIYDKEFEVSQDVPMGTEVSHLATKNTSHAIVRNHLSFKNGAPFPSDGNVTFIKMNFVTESHSDNMEIEKQFKKTGPTKNESISISYRTSDQVSVSFSSTGPTESLIIRTPSEGGRENVMFYTGNSLSAVQNMKDGFLHGQAIQYQDNYLKSLNMRLEDMPNMQNSSIEMVDGKEKIVTRVCWKNGEQLKTSTCSND